MPILLLGGDLRIDHLDKLLYTMAQFGHPYVPWTYVVIDVSMIESNGTIAGVDLIIILGISKGTQLKFSP